MTLLERSDVLVHPWVVGELALGTTRSRDEVLHLLGTMPQVPMIGHDQVLAFITDEKLYGLGIGLVDNHLLASARAVAEVSLWTRDHRLGECAARRGLRFVGSTDAPDQEAWAAITRELLK